MEISFLKLCDEIQFKPSKTWEKTSLDDAKLEDKVFHLSFICNNLIPVENMKEFLYYLNKNFRYITNPSFKIMKKSFDKKEIVNYISWITEDIIENVYLAKEFKTIKSKIDDKGHIYLFDTSDKFIQQYKFISERLSLILSKFGFLKNMIILDKKETQERNKEDEEIINYLSNRMKVKPTNNSYNWKENKNIKNNYYEKVKIEKIRESESSNIETEGKIFNINLINIKNNKTIVVIDITDFKEAITLKRFCSTNDVNFFKSLNTGDYIFVKGSVVKDKFQNDISINIQQLKKKTKEKKTIKHSAEERVELSARTKMSVMDGITSPSKLYNYAKKMGHKAIAITDLDNLQSFPELYNSTKTDKDFKAIFGGVFRITEKNEISKIISKKENFLLKEKNYVIFDLETTGFYANYNGIIEFGACKIQNGKIVSKSNFFINPNQVINEKIQELTGIKNEDIKNAINEKEGMKKIIEFFGDSVLIAHNASFDMSFIYKKIEKYNLDKINNIVIDTLSLSRIIQPKFKRHSLEYLATRYGVEYNSNIAHRADYDAEVLAKTWVKMVGKLEEDRITNSTQLWDIGIKKGCFYRNDYLISILAKNNKGLKHLFKLCSISHTTNFDKIPILSKSDIDKWREGLLIGSGGIDGLVWKKELSNTQVELEKEIDFYDYIEINPPSNMTHIINRGELSNEDIHEVIKNIINTSKKLGKLTIVTTEPRYIYKDDLFIHKIYIESKGLGGISHRLFKYKESNSKYPTLNFMTTTEVKKELSFLNDDELINEIVVKNTNIITDSIDRVEVLKKDLYTPKIDKSSSLLKDIVSKNTEEIYGKNIPEIIKKRIKKELDSIIENKYDVIYWIAHLLVKKSLSSGYIVGSRGSVGSSLVATLAGITDVNPLPPHYYCTKCKYNEFPNETKSKSGYDLIDKKCPSCSENLCKDGHSIPFETFLGFKGEKIPDIDLNFSGKFQKTIHDEVRKIFGEEHCFRAGTISTVAERTAFGYVKAWNETNGIKFSKSYINFLTKRLSGTKRTTGQHPGGIIIIPEEFDVEDFTAINYPANDKTSSWKTTHFDFGAIHDNLLKLDLLGHDDPTMIRMLQDITKINPNDIPNSDPAVLSLFSSTKALKIKASDISGEKTGAIGIPEFGTPFVRSILKSVKVSSFSDLISVSGLSHGTSVWISNAQHDVKNNGLTIDEIISCRDDILNDLIAHKMEPSKAFAIMEQVRKGKSITTTQENEMKELNVPNWYIESCKKIKYMFPKAHATAYVKAAWKIAWFKIYHPLAYYASHLTIRADVFDIKTAIINKEAIHDKLEIVKKKYKSKTILNKITNKEKSLMPIYEICEELYARGFKISPIDIKISDSTDWKIDYETKTLIPPFNVIDGLGDIVAESIIKEREIKEFISVEDFKARTKINKNSLSDLNEIGSLANLAKRNQMSLFD